MIVSQSIKNLVDFYIKTQYENSVVLVFRDNGQFKFLEVESHDLFRYVRFDPHSLEFFLSMEELSPEEESELTDLVDPSSVLIYVAGKEATDGYLTKRFEEL